MRTLTVIPLKAELEAFLQGCRQLNLTVETSRIGRVETRSLPDLDLTLALGGLGKAQFGVQTQYLIDQDPDWEAVLCAGTAGALEGHLAIGDVVAGTQTVEYDIFNHFGKPIVPRFPGAEVLIQGLRNVRLANVDFAIHFGPIASGDEDVVDPARREEVKALTGALAVAWEGAGGARACAFSNLPYLEIRAITDQADETAARDFRANRRRAMGNLARVITEFGLAEGKSNE